LEKRRKFDVQAPTPQREVLAPKTADTLPSPEHSVPDHTQNGNSSPLMCYPTKLLAPTTPISPAVFASEANAKVRKCCPTFCSILVITHELADVRPLVRTKRHFDFRLPIPPHGMPLLFPDLLRVVSTYQEAPKECIRGRSRCSKCVMLRRLYYCLGLAQSASRDPS
jgi:hypothetical protein